MKRGFSLLISVCLLVALLTACSPSSTTQTSSSATTQITDSAGRTVTIPSNITKVSPSGKVATLILSTIAPEYLVTVSSNPSKSQEKYLPSELSSLPETGQMYGSKAEFNVETVLAANPQIIIDLGDPKSSTASDMDELQAKLGIPTIFIASDLENMASAYRTLGSILSGKAEKGEQLASFADKTVTLAKEKSATITDNQKVSVMYSSDTSGLGVNAEGSTQAQVIDLVGAKNAVVKDKASNKGGTDMLSLEEVYKINPNVILFSKGSIYDTVGQDSAWSNLDAIKNNKYYEIPDEPYNWMSSPPSVNMLLGVWWLGNLIYPDVYNYDVKSVVKEYYSLFWNYNLTDEEVTQLLSKSTLK